MHACTLSGGKPHSGVIREKKTSWHRPCKKMIHMEVLGVGGKRLMKVSCVMVEAGQTIDEDARGTTHSINQTKN